MAAPWEKYSAQPAANPWEKYGAQAPAAPNKPDEAPREPGQFVLQNLIKGSADALGAPADTLLSISNLGKAGAGAAMGAAGVKGSNLPELNAPKDVPLTSAWIQERMKSLGLLDQQGEARTTGELIGGGALQMVGGGLVPVKGKVPSMAETSGAQQIAKDAGALRPGLDPQVAQLTRENVSMTPGQIKGGVVRDLEEKAKSWPVLGQSIKEAENRGIASFDQAAGNRALEPLGMKVPKHLTGQELIAHVGDQVDAAYEKLKPNLTLNLDNPTAPKVTPIKPTGNVVPIGGPPQVPMQGAPSLRADLSTVLQNAKDLPPDQMRRLTHDLKTQITDKFAQGKPVSGDDLKMIDTKLGQLAKSYGRMADPYDQELAVHMREAQAVLRQQIERQNPSQAGQLQKVNQAWANLVRLETAGAAIGKHDELFTPAMLDRAVKSTDTMLRKRGYARGEALMQDLSTAGIDKLAPRVNNSGTADRGLLTQILNPKAWAGLASGPAMYNPAVQAFLQRQMTQPTRPPMLPPQAGMIIPGAVPQVPLQGQQ